MTLAKHDMPPIAQLTPGAKLLFPLRVFSKLFDHPEGQHPAYLDDYSFWGTRLVSLVQETATRQRRLQMSAQRRTLPSPLRREDLEQHAKVISGALSGLGPEQQIHDITMRLALCNNRPEGDRAYHALALLDVISPINLPAKNQFTGAKELPVEHPIEGQRQLSPRTVYKEGVWPFASLVIYNCIDAQQATTTNPHQQSHPQRLFAVT